MARLSRASVGIVLLIACVSIACVGCAQNKADAPASPAVVRAVRQKLTKTNPQVLVGAVTAVEPNGKPFAAVGDVPAAQFHVGEPIAFLNANQEVLTHGIVRRILPDSIHVQWYPPRGEGRAPRVGDLAVRYRPTAPMTSPMEPATEPPMVPPIQPAMQPTMQPAPEPTTAPAAPPAPPQ
jgi:hypothetical protein